MLHNPDNPMDNGPYIHEDLELLVEAFEDFVNQHEHRHIAFPALQERAKAFKDRWDIIIRFGQTWEDKYGGR